MKTLPRIPEPPAKLGALQYSLWLSVANAAVAFDQDDSGELDPRRASTTLNGFARHNLGLDERQIKRTAKTLVDRRILKESKVGWCLADEEFTRLERQARREREGVHGD
jgi:hypothetical protein